MKTVLNVNGYEFTALNIRTMHQYAEALIRLDPNYEWEDALAEAVAIYCDSHEETANMTVMDLAETVLAVCSFKLVY